jgi:hypothetical protein
MADFIVAPCNCYMTHSEFQVLSAELSSLVGIIPLHWGDIQNDGKDSELNLFNIHSFAELEQGVASLAEPLKQYFRRRWFLWKCSQCDEYLFSINPNVNRNPNHKDRQYDIEFNNNPLLRFDIKGTHIPKEFLVKIPNIIENPVPMVQFFYEKQSRGVRHNTQNRLFIVHHSFVDSARENLLRCCFDFKRDVFSNYSKGISPASNFIKYKNCLVDIIFILEKRMGAVEYKFYSFES